MENKRLIAAAKTAVWLRNYQRARVRALTKLANTYPDEYKEIFEQEKINDYTQGKAWIDLNGNTSPSMDTNTRTDTSKGGDTPNQTSNQARTGNL
jgi:hypothetical protein